MRSTVARLEMEVAALAAVDPAGLPIASLQELVAGAAGLAQRLTGIGSRALAELQVRGQGRVPDPSSPGGLVPTPAWLRDAARLTGTAAGRQIRTAVALRELPAVVDAIVDGTISPQHGQVLSRLVGKIEPRALLATQPQLIEVARRCDPHALEQYVRHLIASWCEPDLEAEEAAAEDRRFLQVRNRHNGSWRGSFELPDAAMEGLLTVLEPLARRAGDDDPRTAGQRRADALVDVFDLALRHGDLPDAGGARPQLTYVIPAWWSAELAGTMHRLRTDPLAKVEPGGDLGSLGLTSSPNAVGDWALDLDRHPGQDIATGPWAGPVTRDRIAALLCDSRIQRVVLDAAGQVVSLESVSEQITAAQRRAVGARDRCCTAKGCSRPPAFCDVHHLVARADGGSTDLGNLVLLCRRHHVQWHRGRLGLADLRVPWLRVPQPTSRPRAPALE